MPPRALIIAEDGVDDLELYYTYYRLLEAGYEVYVASHESHSNTIILDPETGSLTRAPRKLKGKHGIEHRVDLTYREALSREWDLIAVPGGRSPERARLHGEAIELLKRHAAKGKPIIAICHGPLLLASAGLLKGRRVTGHPGIADDLKNAGANYTGRGAEADGNIVTVRHTTTIHEGFQLLLSLLDQSRGNVA